MKTLTFDTGEVYQLVDPNKPKITFCEVARHLLLGGWVEDRDYSNASYFIRVGRDNNLEMVFKRDDSGAEFPWKSWHLSFSKCEMKDWKLIQPQPWAATWEDTEK